MSVVSFDSNQTLEFGLDAVSQRELVGLQRRNDLDLLHPLRRTALQSLQALVRERFSSCGLLAQHVHTLLPVLAPLHC